MTWAQVLIVPFEVSQQWQLVLQFVFGRISEINVFFTKCHAICHASLLMTDIDNAQERFRRAQEQVQTKAGSRVVFIDLFSQQIELHDGLLLSFPVPPTRCQEVQSSLLEQTQ